VTGWTQLWPILQGLLLVMAANGAPVLGKRLLGESGSRPIDGGWMFPDSKPLLGPSKSWRGVVLGVVTPAAAAPLLGVTWTVGLLVGAAAMAGDLLSSFFKRRLGIPSGGMARGIDQVPEALLPLLAARDALGLSLGEAFVATVLFWASEITVSPILHRLGIRERPY
jgi:CDP-2,3-bis-(O-geranylgeranyl)-sn-glycerol synthase